MSLGTCGSTSQSLSRSRLNSCEPRGEEACVPAPTALLDPDICVASGEALGLKDTTDREIPLADIRAEPGKEGVRVNLFCGRGPSGARGTSLVKVIGWGVKSVGESERSISTLESGYALLELVETGPGVIGIGADMMGFGGPIIIVDDLLGRGARGPPGKVGIKGSSVLDLLGVDDDGGVVSPLRDGGPLAETSFRGVLLGSFSLPSPAEPD